MFPFQEAKIMGAKGEQVVLGLKLGGRAVRLVQLRHLDDGFLLLKCGSERLPLDLGLESLMDQDGRSRIVDAISSVLESYRIETKTVATSIDSKFAIVKRVPLEEGLKKEEELRSYIYWQAGQYILAPVEEYVVDFQLMSPDKGEAILVAARKEVIDGYVQVLEAVGLDPVVIDVDCFAIHNAFELNYRPGAGQVVAVVNVEPNLNDIVVLRAGEFYFQESFAGQQVNAEGASYDLLCAVISRRLKGAFSTLEPEKEGYDKIFLSGHGALDSRLAQYLGLQHGSPIETANPFLRVRVDPSLAEQKDFSKEASKYMISLGLAIRREEK